MVGQWSPSAIKPQKSPTYGQNLLCENRLGYRSPFCRPLFDSLLIFSSGIVRQLFVQWLEKGQYVTGFVGCGMWSTMAKTTVLHVMVHTFRPRPRAQMLFTDGTEELGYIKAATLQFRKAANQPRIEDTAHWHSDLFINGKTTMNIFRTLAEDRA